MTKQKILEFVRNQLYLRDCESVSCRVESEKRIAELSTMLDQYRAEVVGDVPCERKVDCRNAEMELGYNVHVAEVEEWKKKKEGGV